MDAEEERLLKKIRTRNNVIFKYGTYTMDAPSNNDANSNAEADNNASAPAPATTSEEDAKIAEIMNKFSSNIQNNVSSLFENY